MSVIDHVRKWDSGMKLAVGASAVLGVTVAVLLSGAARGDPAANVAPKDRAAIEAIVREYILSHPEIIPEAINGLQNREVTKLIENNRKEIETPFAGAFAGDPKGDVRLVVFFDYACPYCKAAHNDVRRLMAEDKRLKIVFRDFPVLSDQSTEAAMASLSAAQQGRYLAFHDGIFDSAGRVSHEKTIAAVRTAGLNEMRTAKDLNSPALKAEIKKNLDLGRALGLTGTPSYIVGNRILSGAVGYEALKTAVAEARASNK
ncbi:DsbA family protein [Glacieibacterium frigidum]|uniref:DsbA family protein n=1 Tax=Glacieibacterium frigidum TaxID=2593303 RepID=A0A552UG68_9SPHN|nr:DsbA family protein [Glacieibacterium frigidum]TRW17179.1 DsbA family protein [Glacieibacterium frigidum]